MRIDRIRKLKPDEGFEYLCLRPRDTGLPYDVLLDSIGTDRNRNRKHPKPPTLKIRYRENVFIPAYISYWPLRGGPGTIPMKALRACFGDQEHIPKDLKRTLLWILCVHDILEKHYRHEISDREIFACLEEREAMLERKRKEMIKRIFMQH